METTLEALAAQVREARRDVDRAKMLYAAHEGTYDDMAAAAKRLSSLMAQYAAARFPLMRPRRVPYQAILR
jgi:hypothetical protein